MMLCFVAPSDWLAIVTCCCLHFFCFSFFLDFVFLWYHHTYHTYTQVDRESGGAGIFPEYVQQTRKKAAFGVPKREFIDVRRLYSSVCLGSSLTMNNYSSMRHTFAWCIHSTGRVAIISALLELVFAAVASYQYLQLRRTFYFLLPPDDNVYIDKQYSHIRSTTVVCTIHDTHIIRTWHIHTYIVHCMWYTSFPFYFHQNLQLRRERERELPLLRQASGGHTCTTPCIL